MKMFLSVVGKKENVVLRHELKEQMMDVSLGEEPGKGVGCGDPIYHIM